LGVKEFLNKYLLNELLERTRGGFKEKPLQDRENFRNGAFILGSGDGMGMV